MVELIPVLHSASLFVARTKPFIGNKDILYNILPYPGSLILKPIIHADDVECTEMFGQDSPTSTKFNDYEELVGPTLRGGNKIRISRIKLYKNKSGIIGIKLVYTVIDKYGKVTKHERPHRSKAVNFFTSRSSMNFSLSEYPLIVVGSFTSHMIYLRVASTNAKTIESGKEQGLKFIIQSKSNKHIVALSGSFSDYFYTLRAYYMDE